MKQVVFLSAQKRKNVKFYNHRIVRLGIAVSKNAAINCIITSADDFDIAADRVTIKQGTILKDGELAQQHFTDPLTPDYVFLSCDSEDPNENLQSFKLLEHIAERGIPVNFDGDASKIDVKSILEERCKTFELVSGLQILRPKTVIINGPGDKQKIVDFIKANGASILKPHDSSRGRGIQTIATESQINQLIFGEDRYVLQNLIPNPMTLNGYKIGLRVYLMIQDLRKPVYSIPEQGLVKLAVQPYIRGNAESEIVGSSYAERLGYTPVMYLFKDLLNSDQKSTWTEIRYSIEKTLSLFMESVSWRANMSCRRLPSFQCWGVDIAIEVTDEGPKAHLIEVNTTPALYRNNVKADNATDIVFTNELFVKAVAGYSQDI